MPKHTCAGTTGTRVCARIWRHRSNRAQPSRSCIKDRAERVIGTAGPNASAARPAARACLQVGPPSAAQLELARAAGYKTVISPLPEQEAGDEARHARVAGLRFWSIPIAGPDDLTEANAMQLSAAMNERGAQPLIIHCASGNRVGALLALKAYNIDHESKQAAIELGERAGLQSFQPAVEAKLK